jgi:hypothetical protein
VSRPHAISPQLRALGADIRLLAVYLDAIAAYGFYCSQVQGRVDTALLTEQADGEGWNEDPNSRVMASRGWRDADGIYDAAGIPEKHRRVMDLVLFSDLTQSDDPSGRRKGGFSNAEIAHITGHPERTVKLWIHNDIPKLRRLNWGEANTCLVELSA